MVDTVKAEKGCDGQRLSSTLLAKGTKFDSEVETMLKDLWKDLMSEGNQAKKQLHNISKAIVSELRQDGMEARVFDNMMKAWGQDAGGIGFHGHEHAFKPKYRGNGHYTGEGAEDEAEDRAHWEAQHGEGQTPHLVHYPRRAPPPRCAAESVRHVWAQQARSITASTRSTIGGSTATTAGSTSTSMATRAGATAAMTRSTSTRTSTTGSPTPSPSP